MARRKSEKKRSVSGELLALAKDLKVGLLEFHAVAESRGLVVTMIFDCNKREEEQHD